MEVLIQRRQLWLLLICRRTVSSISHFSVERFCSLAQPPPPPDIPHFHIIPLRLHFFKIRTRDLFPPVPSHPNPSFSSSITTCNTNRPQSAPQKATSNAKATTSVRFGPSSHASNPSWPSSATKDSLSTTLAKVTDPTCPLSLPVNSHAARTTTPVWESATEDP